MGEQTYGKGNNPNARQKNSANLRKESRDIPEAFLNHQKLGTQILRNTHHAATEMMNLFPVFFFFYIKRILETGRRRGTVWINLRSPNPTGREELHSVPSTAKRETLK